MVSLLSLDEGVKGRIRDSILRERGGTENIERFVIHGMEGKSTECDIEVLWK